MGDPKLMALKRIMHQFLEDRYGRNDQIVERVCTALQTQGDMEAFVKMIMDCYELGYTRAVNDHREQLEKAGLTVKIVSKS